MPYLTNDKSLINLLDNCLTIHITLSNNSHYFVTTISRIINERFLADWRALYDYAVHILTGHIKKRHKAYTSYVAAVPTQPIRFL